MTYEEAFRYYTPRMKAIGLMSVIYQRPMTKQTIQTVKSGLSEEEFNRRNRIKRKASLAKKGKS